jgi:hypothetical protein
MKTSSRRWRHCAWACAWGALTLFLLQGCKPFGTMELSAGRPAYNEVIHQTAINQIFANIIRVYHNEPTLFMDVGEVDAAYTFQGSISGGVSAIGATPHPSGRNVGAFSAGLEYQESPTIRYQPLSGSALIAQISSPMTVDSIASLLNSDWPVLNVLMLAADRLTPGPYAYYSALNTIAELDNYYALGYSATKSPITSVAVDPTSSKGGPAGGGGGQSSAPPPNDSLTIFLATDQLSVNYVRCQPETAVPCPHPRPDRTRKTITPQTVAGDNQAEIQKLQTAEQTVLTLWIRLLKLYRTTQPWGNEWTERKLDRFVAKHTLRDAMEYRRFPKSIELRTVPVAEDGAVVLVKTKTIGRQPEKASTTTTTITTANTTGADGSTTKKNNTDSETNNANTNTNTYTNTITGTAVYYDPDRLPVNRAPPLRLRSGLGIMVQAFQGPAYINMPPEIQSLEKNRGVYDTIVRRDWHKDATYYYTFSLADTETSVNWLNCVQDVSKQASSSSFDPNLCLDPAKADAVLSVNDWLTARDRWRQQPDDVAIQTITAAIKYPNLIADAALATQRRFILIFRSKEEPLAAFTQYQDPHDGVWYYIQPDDDISKFNLSLLLQIMTMQAQAPSPGLTPTISVGGSH